MARSPGFSGGGAAGGAFRHEFKYVSPEGILAAIESRVRAVMAADPHARGGSYSVSSVYFDDIYGSRLHECEDGVDPREKFRIRIYDGSARRITLELKRKERDMTQKLSCPISLGRCAEILEGRFSPARALSFLEKKLALQMAALGLRPVCVVRYERAAFVCKAGNARVTFDRNIRSSSGARGLFDADAARRPVLPLGVNMMEVKYDELLPDYIAEVLQTGALERTSFSKYCLCRKFAPPRAG